MSQADVALLRDAYRDFNSADFPAASQALAPDIEWVESGTGMPYSGTWHGTASVVNDVWTSFVQYWGCLLYTSDAADDLLCVDLGGRRIIKKKKKKQKQ